MDRRDEILEQEYFKYYRPDFPSDERTSEVVKMALSIKEETQAIKNAMDENGKRLCLELLEYMAKNSIECIDSIKGYLFYYRGQYLTKEQLFENFL